MNKEVTFQKSRIIGTTIFLIGMGFLMSVIPEVNLLLFACNTAIALVAFVLFYLFWKKTKHNSKRYFSLLSYVMINTLAIYFVIPLLRIYFLTTTFWIGVIMLLVMVTLPYLYSREIAFGVQRPNKSKLGKIYLIFTVLLLVFGATAYMGSLTSSHTDAVAIGILLFLMGLLFLFLSPIFLIKPKEMNRIKGR